MLLFFDLHKLICTTDCSYLYILYILGQNPAKIPEMGWARAAACYATTSKLSERIWTQDFSEVVSKIGF